MVRWGASHLGRSRCRSPAWIAGQGGRFSAVTMWDYLEYDRRRERPAVRPLRARCRRDGRDGAARGRALPSRSRRGGCGSRSSTSRPSHAPAPPDSGRVSTRERSERTPATSPTARPSRRRSRSSRSDWGVPHLLVNAAAIDAPPTAPVSEVGPFEDVPLEALERVVHVNVLGVVVPCQVIGGAMARAGRGSIVNVGSVYGLLSPDQGLYDFRRADGRGVLQAGGVLGLEVRTRQSDPLPRDLLGPERRPRQHADAARDRERPARRRSSRRSRRDRRSGG